MILLSWVLQLVGSGIAGLVSALFVSFLSRRQSIQQYWWDKKAEAYIVILAALCDKVDYCEAAMRSDESKESQEWLDRWAEKCAEGDRAVQRAMRLGDFLISAEAHAAFDQIRKDRAEFKDSPFRHDESSYIHTEHHAAKTCIKALRAAARADLGQGLRWRSIWPSQL